MESGQNGESSKWKLVKIKSGKNKKWQKLKMLTSGQNEKWPNEKW